MKNEAQQIFEGITTNELISYKVMGDNSTELKQELQRRLELDITSRIGKINNIELDAKSRFEKVIVLN